MHQIMHTEAFVLSSIPSGEANKILKLLTMDYGVIQVVAQGVRKNESKLQQSVQQFSLAKVALIQGRTGWRLTNAIVEKNYFYLLDFEIIKMIGQLFSIIERMMPDEDTCPEIFSLIVTMFSLFEKSANNIQNKQIQNIEVAVLGKIMYELGYVGDENLRLELNKPLTEIVKYVENHQRNIVKIINKAINESQL